MDGQRRERLRKAVAECLSAPRATGWAEAMCVATVAAVGGVDAAALTLRTDSHGEEMIGASERWAARLEETQYTLGEGPGVEAFGTGGPVLVADIRAEQARWPGFADAASAAGAAAMFAFPLQIGGIRLGTLDLYRRHVGGLSPVEVGDASVLAELSTLALLEDAERTGPDDLHVVISYQDVNVATGMLAVYLRISLEDAFSRLRAHAYATDRSVIELARDVLARRIPLDRLAD